MLNKVIFVHDHKITKYKNEFYTNGNFPPEVIKRYSDLACNFNFISNGKEVYSKPSGLTKTYILNGGFVFIPDLKKTFKLAAYRSKIEKLHQEIVTSDLVFARLPSYLGKKAVAIASKENIPYVIEVVGNQYESYWYHGHIGGKVLAPFADLEMRKIIRDSQNVIYITEQYLQNRYPSENKKFIVPNVYIEDNLYREENINMRFEEMNNLKQSGELKIVLVGSYDVKYKGHDILIQSLSNFDKEQQEKIKVYFIGQGDSTNIKKMISNKSKVDYVFLGNIPHEEMFELFTKVDLMVQPSKTEAQGRVLIEAMSQGCPVFASSVGGVVELLPSQCLFSKNDHIDLFKKIEKFIGNPTEYQDVVLRNFYFSLNFKKSQIEDHRSMVYRTIIEDIK